MILILGFTNRTSFSLAKYLLLNNPVVIADQSDTLEKKELLDQLRSYGTVIDELGNQDVLLLNKYKITQIFISPGVPRSTPIIQEALKYNIEILNDIELFYRIFPNRTYVAITGTDGKTTVTTWLGNVVARERKVVLVGNIGIPIFDYHGSEYDDYIFIVELSSFQLESITHFHPSVALMTNISEDHTDRYKNMDEYASAKKKIFMNQTSSDFACINIHDAWTMSSKETYPALKKYFAYDQPTDCFYQQGFIYYEGNPFFDIALLQVVGKHNILNALLIVLASKALQLSDDVIKASLQEFTGVKHRLQFLGIYKGIGFYNDSKATTPQALSLALQSFEKPVILLAGGKSKGSDFRGLKDLVHQSTKSILLFGEMALELKEQWGTGMLFKTMKEALETAVTIARPGDSIILSPGGASFDEYKSYADRGDHFMKMVSSYYADESL
ncbi:MAG: UDP-N-acetylmuramoyl-L-alanine--D-glutamate ligase [Brevinema sp.]